MALRTEEGQFTLIIDRWRAYIEANRGNPRKVAEGTRQIMAAETSHLISLHQAYLKDQFERRGAYPPDMAAFTRPEGRTDAFGLIFVYLPTRGQVLSRALLREEFMGHWVTLQRALTAWHSRHGAYPPDLGTLKVRPPRFPFTVTFPYDPASGTIDLPAGYGDDPAAFLVLMVSAALRGADMNEGSPSEAQPADIWAAALPDGTRQRFQDLRARYADWNFKMLAGPPRPAFAMRDTSGTTLVADDGGRVWRGTTLVIPAAWPADLAGWEQVVQ
jgi:hypothetical protein